MTIEDKKQQENLKNFDRNLKASTDQLAWFLYWMPRNLVNRIEVLAPVYDKDMRRDLLRTIDYGLKDTSNVTSVVNVISHFLPVLFRIILLSMSFLARLEDKEFAPCTNIRKTSNAPSKETMNHQ